MYVAIYVMHLNVPTYVMKNNLHLNKCMLIKKLKLVNADFMKHAFCSF